MVGGQDFEGAGAVDLATQVGDADVGFEDELRGVAAQGHQHLGPDGPHLVAQVVGALFDLEGGGVVIAGRAAFEYVGDVDVGPLEAGQFQQLIQAFASGADERQAAQVLVAARGLADQHDLGLGVTRAEDDVGTALAELALAAISQLRLYFFKGDVHAADYTVLAGSGVLQGLELLLVGGYLPLAGRDLGGVGAEVALQLGKARVALLDLTLELLLLLLVLALLVLQLAQLLVELVVCIAQVTHGFGVCRAAMDLLETACEALGPADVGHRAGLTGGFLGVRDDAGQVID